jgi:hypothetical protein
MSKSQISGLTHTAAMDSPPLSKLIGNVNLADESFGDMSLPSADSPAPIRSKTLRGTGFGSLLNRPAPTRNIEETPKAQRTFSGNSSAASSSSATASDRPRYSIFGPGPSHSLKSSTSNTLKRSPRDVIVDQKDEEEPQEEGEGEEEKEKEEEEEDEGDGDRTITIEQEQEQEEQTAAGRAAREEKLKDSLYELRGMNDTFEMFLGALESARGHNEVSPSLICPG